MDQRLAALFATLWRAAVVVLAADIAIMASLTYFAGNGTPPPPILANAYASPFLMIHIVGGVVALLIGPVQFLRRIRARTPALHRATGMIYVAGCAAAAPAGFMLALGTTAGPLAGTGFALLAVLTALFTALGLRAAIGRRFDEHREWMLRSYAMTATAITLRVMLPAAGLIGLDFLPAYQAIAWLSWITNLVLVEAYIRQKRAPVASKRSSVSLAGAA